MPLKSAATKWPTLSPLSHLTPASVPLLHVLSDFSASPGLGPVSSRPRPLVVVNATTTSVGSVSHWVGSGVAFGFLMSL